MRDRDCVACIESVPARADRDCIFLHDHLPEDYEFLGTIKLVIGGIPLHRGASRDSDRSVPLCRDLDGGQA